MKRRLENKGSLDFKNSKKLHTAGKPKEQFGILFIFTSFKTFRPARDSNQRTQRGPQSQSSKYKPNRQLSQF